MSSIEERREKAQELLKSYRDINGIFGNHLVKQDLEKLSSGQGYTVDTSGAVTLKDIGYLVPGGLSTDQKQSAAEAYNELSKLKDLESKIGGRDRTKLRDHAGGALSLNNIDEAIVAYEEGKEKEKITEGREYAKELERDRRGYEADVTAAANEEAARIRKDQALEAEKIRADSNLRASQDRLLEAQMRNADRALEREIRMFEIDEKGSNRKAELFKALFGLGSAFMI